MTQRSIVQRLISFLKKSEPDDTRASRPTYNSYDDYEPHEVRPEPGRPYASEAATPPAPAAVSDTFVGDESRGPGYASRLDALVMRALQQFNAEIGYVIRQQGDGRMRYCTGRDWHGRYVAYTEVAPDRKTVALTIKTGQSQLVVRRPSEIEDGRTVLCGPLWYGSELVGLLYLDQPARNRLHRGVFEIFCQQIARIMVSESEVAYA